MIYVKREPILDALNELYEKVDGKFLSKAEKQRVLTELILMVNGLEEFDPYNEDPDNFYAPPARKIAELEPLVMGSRIGKENYYCSNCKTRVKQKDAYCRHCGHKFEEDGEDA